MSSSNSGLFGIKIIKNICLIVYFIILMTNFGKFIDKNNAVTSYDSILHGPDINLGVPRCTIGVCIIQALRKMPPDLVLMVESESSRTLRAEQLLTLSSKLAIALHNKYGLVRNDRVAIIGANTIDHNIASVATFILGAVLSPINPNLHSAKYQSMLSSLSPKLIISDACITHKLDNALKRIFAEITIVTIQFSKTNNYLSRLIMDVDDSNSTNLKFEDDFNENETAAIMFTSGSSGTPKGVVLSHFSLMYQSTLLARINAWHLTPLKPAKFRPILQAPFVFWISGVLTLISSTTHGVPRILIKSTDPLTILCAVSKHKPERGELSPVLFAQVINHPQVRKFNLTSLTVITLAGSPVDVGILHQAQKVLPNCRVSQVYELTEIGGFLAYANFVDNVMDMGKILPGFQVKVVDTNTKKIIEINTDGYILCKGPSLMSEYLDKEYTDRAVDADGWLYTGDVGRVTGDGVLHVTGRANGFIFVEGQQIIPEELERIILKLNGVADVAISEVDRGRHKVPVGLIVLRNSAQVSEDDINNAVRGNVPKLKQLEGIRFISSVPRTSTGKIDRKVAHDLAENLFLTEK